MPASLGGKSPDSVRHNRRMPTVPAPGAARPTVEAVISTGEDCERIRTNTPLNGHPPSKPGLPVVRSSNVRRTGSPRGVRSPAKWETYTSRANALRALVNTIDRPSGENDGSSSPSESGGGNVSRRFSPSLGDRRYSDRFSPGATVSGHNEPPAGGIPGNQRAQRGCRVVYFRDRPFRPPVDGITTTALFSFAPNSLGDRAGVRWRRKAIDRPSGDHAGAMSTNGSFVKRTGSSSPTTFI